MTDEADGSDRPPHSDDALQRSDDALQRHVARAAVSLGIATVLAGCNVETGSDDEEESGDEEDSGDEEGGGDESGDAELSRTQGRGARAIHEGTFVIGDSSPRQITSQGPDEVRSQVPFYAPAFQTTSARAAKTGVEPVDPGRILDGVSSLPISTWRFDGCEDGRHLGPMAEKFHETFELGRSNNAVPDDPDGTIATVDADGVAFAAIQGFARRLDVRNRELREKIEKLDRYADRLETRLDACEKKRGSG